MRTEMLRFQRGVSIVFVAVVLIVVAAASLAFLALTRTSTGIDRSNETTSHLAKVGNALEQFASASERLPCPANPALDAGDAEPNAASAACTFAATGTVPWRTLGLRREDALDAWGWKISYRVYHGATGLTQMGGASMVHCDKVEPVPAGASPTGLCLPSHDTIESQFLFGKGLTVNDFGTAVTDAAYVLVSHGASGMGAYTASGMQKSPLPSSADEASNLGGGPFVAKAAVSTVSPEDVAHFDDVLAYRRLADFVTRANLSARDWPEPGATYVDVSLNTATVSTALGTPASYGDLGQSALNFPSATVTAFDGSSNENISFQNVSGTEGIGGTVGTPGISSDSSEGVRIDFALKSQHFAVTLNHFGKQTGAGAPRDERVEFRFLDNLSQQVHSVSLNGCRNDGGLASFSIDVPAGFYSVEIRALPTTGATTTEFYLAQFKTCAASPCATALSVGPPNNTCP